MNPQQQMLERILPSYPSRSMGAQVNMQELSKVLSDLDERLLRVEGESSVFRSRDEEAVEMLNNGFSTKNHYEDPYLKALSDVARRVRSLTDDCMNATNVLGQIDDLRKAHE